ncbi:MAG: DUF177 domain-containing protein [Clostridia bacterium]|nr:DUF177 domain-containing protein [Clostridia bacterium]
MKLDVAQAIRQPGTAFPFRAEQAIAPQEIYGDPVTFDPAVMEGTYRAQEDGTVTVTGRLSVTAHAKCANCLRPAQAEVSAGFEEDFLFGGDPEDDEVFVYSGSAIELDRLALTYAMLNLPMRFLCSADCPGLQEYVADDKTVSLCQKELPGQHPFAALQRLLTEEESAQADDGTA